MFLSGKLIGPHIIGGVDRSLGGDYIPDVLAQWQPRLIVVLNPNENDMRKLRSTCPNAVIVQRIYVPDNEVSDRILGNPRTAAEYFHSQVILKRAHFLNADPMVFVQVENEVVHYKFEQLRLLNEYAIESIKLANANGLKRCLFNFSVGHPDIPENDRLSWWREFYPSMRLATTGGHLIGVHQYGGNSIFSPNGGAWTSGRLENQILPRLPKEFDSLKFAVTEFGVSHVQGAPKGWRLSYDMDAEAYNRDMQQHADWVIGKGLHKRIVGYAVFTWGRESVDWQPNDIEGECARVIAGSGTRLPSVDFRTWMNAGNSGGAIDNPPSSSPIAYRARVVNTNGQNLNLRNAPSTSSAIIGKLSAGSIVDVLQETPNVYKHVKQGALEGYASGAFLERLDGGGSQPPTQPPTPDLSLLENRILKLESTVLTLEARIFKLEEGGGETTPPTFPPDFDPREPNARAFRLNENGRVVGVNLSYFPVASSKWRLVYAALIDEETAQGQTVATITVRNLEGISQQVICYLAWPWKTGWNPPNPMANRLKPGNLAYPYQHIITNGFSAAAGEQGPLAIYIGDAAGNIQSDVIAGLGLPDKRHVGYRFEFIERHSST